MEKSKIVYILRKLSLEDRERFTDFVASPYFNRKSSLGLLLEQLLKNYLGHGPFIDKDELYKLVFGKGTVNESTLRTSVSELMALLNRFLAIQRYENDRQAQDRNLLEALVEIDAHKHFPAYHKKAVANLEKSRLDSWEHYQHHLELWELEHAFRHQLPSRKANENLESGVDHLNFGYISRFLRYQLYAVSGAVSFAELTTKVNRSILDLVKEIALSYEDAPRIVHLYLLLLDAYSRPLDLEQFENLVQLAKSVLPETSRNEYQDIYTLTINYAAKRINQGETTLIPPTLKFYQFLIDEGLIRGDSGILSWHFKNIVSLASRDRQFAWATEFIRKWRNKVSPDFQDNAYQFNMGVLRFYEKKFHESESHFFKVLQDYEDLFYGLNARGYLLQIHYELQDMKSLEAQTHSLRMFLDRQKGISWEKKRQYIEFLNHLKRLCNIPPLDINKREKLKQHILGKRKRGMGTEWLIEKIDELG